AETPDGDVGRGATRPARHRRAACELLEKHGACCGYRRDGKDFRPDPLLQHYDVARRRAWRLAENHEAGKRLTDRNPFTSVWLLADRLIAQNGARP
ncbi:MAG: hypothetical protein IRY84_16905, partial [Thermobispora bispora]|nr:hypothetical protein [Thermobispora bispora]